MLLEMFLLLQAITIISFSVAYFKKSEFFWAFTILLSAVLIFASYDIIQSVNTVQNQTMIGNSIYYNNVVVEHPVIDRTYSYINMGIFGLALVLFFFDLFNNWKENKSVQRK